MSYMNNPLDLHRYRIHFNYPKLPECLSNDTRLRELHDQMLQNIEEQRKLEMLQAELVSEFNSRKEQLLSV